MLIEKKRDPYSDWGPWHLSFRLFYKPYKRSTIELEEVKLGPFILWRCSNPTGELNRLCKELMLKLNSGGYTLSGIPDKPKRLNRFQILKESP
jgi:hypothetical protein